MTSKEANLAACKKYKQKHKEEIAAYGKKYYQEHKEEENASSKKYYQEHKKELSASQKKRRQENKEEYAFRDKKNNLKRREKRAAHLRKKNYGIEEDQYQNMISAQNNYCASCGDIFSNSPCVDHCHKTGKIRGLLCKPCNLALGNLKDSFTRIIRLANYARKNV